MSARAGGGGGRRQRGAPAFFKLLDHQSASLSGDPWLSIPPRFIQLYATRLTAKTTIRGPDDAVWTVAIGGESLNTIGIRSGWKGFISAYSLKPGDMVVLRLVEDSLFEAEVFGEKTQLERLPELTRQERTLRSTEKRLEPSSTPTLTARNTAETPRRGRPPKKRLSDPSPETLSRAIITSPTAKRRCSQDGQRTSPSVPKRRPVTEEEKTRALNQAESFTSENPFTIVVMKHSNVSSGFFMGMRSEFAREIMPAANTEVTLIDSTNKTWSVRWLGKTRSGDRNVNIGLSGGWRKFAVDHALEEGDVCVFECVDQNVDHFVLRVHIYRVVELSKATLNNNDSFTQENDCRELVIAITANEDCPNLVVAPTRYKVGRLIGRRKNGGIWEYLVGLEGTEEMESVGNLENGGVGRWWVPIEGLEDGFQYCRV